MTQRSMPLDLLNLKFSVIRVMAPWELMEVAHALKLDLERRRLRIRADERQVSKFRSLLTGQPLALLANVPCYAIRRVERLHREACLELSGRV